MNINSSVISALSSLNLPTYPDVYLGTATEYIVFNVVDERPVLVADDTDKAEEVIFRANYFTKGNPEAKKTSIKSLLRAAGFNVLSLQQFYEQDTKFIHVVIECSIDGEI